DKIDPAALAGQPNIRVSYDALDEIQSLAWKGIISNADKAAVAALSSSPVLAPLLDAVQAKAQEFSLIRGHLVVLQGALGLTADDIRRVLEDARESLETAALSLPHLSLLYRYGLLAKGLKLPIRDLIALRQLSGLD